MQVDALFVHRQYNTVTLGNDLALLLLSRSINRTSFVHEACLPKEKESFVGKIVTVTGWGSLSEGDINIILSSIFYKILLLFQLLALFIFTIFTGFLRN